MSDTAYPASVDTDIALDESAMRGGTQDDLDGTGAFDLANMLRRLQTGLVAVETRAGVALSANLAGVLGGVAGATVANTTTETSLLSSTVTVPANFLTANSKLRVVAYGTLVMNNNTADTVALKLKLGSVALATGVGLPNGTSGLSATARKWRYVAEIVAASVGASGTLHSAVEWAMSIPTSGDVAALTSGSYLAVGGAAATVDTTAIQALDLRATWSAAASTDSMVCTFCSVESIPTLT